MSYVIARKTFSTAAATYANGTMRKSTQSLFDDLTLDEDGSEEVTLRKRMALARAITLIESKAAAKRQQADVLLTNLLANEDAINKTSSSFRLGIAGPPGAGKSTFIETFGMHILNKASTSTNKETEAFVPSKLAVVCIDPSSNVTGGSILGDKTRMMDLSRHERAYVRPSANGGTFGGLSAYTHDVVSLCQAASYELVLVESVGLGQSEVEIQESVDMLVLMVPPGGGDELQGVKKGIVEVADMLIVNKADGNLLQAARSTASQYRGAMTLLRPRTEGWTTPVLLTSAYTGEGVPEVWDKICEFRSLMLTSGELEEKRLRQSRYWMWKNLNNLITLQTQSNPELRRSADAMERALDAGAITPRLAAAQLLDSLLRSST